MFCRLREAELLFQADRVADSDRLLRTVVRKNPTYAGASHCIHYFLDITICLYILLFVLSHTSQFAQLLTHSTMCGSSPLTQSLAPSLARSLTHSLIHSLTHSLTHPPTHPPIHPPTHLFTCMSTYFHLGFLCWHIHVSRKLTHPYFVWPAICSCNQHHCSIYASSVVITSSCTPVLIVS